MKKFIAIFMTCILLFLMTGCAAHIHEIGKGAQGSKMTEVRQWYALWGLIPINEVDSGDMAGDATDYTIKTESDELDIIINIFTANVSVVSRTVTVTK
ncbi:hypothetical protein HQ585_14735 [candidate division KSB1 bacterium]|nr:hypothetical protein [candidate division KSB1 bacterium]